MLFCNLISTVLSLASIPATLLAVFSHLPVDSVQQTCTLTLQLLFDRSLVLPLPRCNLDGWVGQAGWIITQGARRWCCSWRAGTPRMRLPPTTLSRTSLARSAQPAITLFFSCVHSSVGQGHWQLVSCVVVCVEDRHTEVG